MELGQELPAFKQRGLGVASITYDAPEVVRAFASKYKIQYPLLSDKGSRVIERFGMLNTNWKAGHVLHGVSYAGSFLIDANGVVRERFPEDNGLDRRTAASFLVREGAAGTGTQEYTSDWFKVKTAASNSVIAPGSRFMLILDFELQPGIHAYAPGAKGYRPLALRLVANPHLRVHPTRFPASRPYVFAPLKETVPVFEGRFRVLQELTLDSGLRDARPTGEAVKLATPELQVNGTLDYQVCSDTICYPPASLPLRWSFKVEPLAN